ARDTAPTPFQDRGHSRRWRRTNRRAAPYGPLPPGWSPPSTDSRPGRASGPVRVAVGPGRPAPVPSSRSKCLQVAVDLERCHLRLVLPPFFAFFAQEPLEFGFSE